ncbi:hypothetical protein M378DRAFT_158238, partial [Amanita muscaria Koide BX008]
MVYRGNSAVIVLNCIFVIDSSTSYIMLIITVFLLRFAPVRTKQICEATSLLYDGQYTLVCIPMYL